MEQTNEMALMYKIEKKQLNITLASDKFNDR